MWFSIIKKTKLVCILLVALWLFPNSVVAQGQAPIILDESTLKANLYPGIGMLKDRKRVLTIEAVIAEDFTDRFMLETDIRKKIGFFETANWLRFEVDNRSEESNWLIEFAFPLIHELELYTIEEGQPILLRKTGADDPFHEREMEHRNFVINLDIEPGTTKIYYVLAVGSGDLHPPINIWDKDAFIEKTQREFMLLGIFYGVVIVMILYNTLLYVGLRLKSYLYYVLAISCTLLGQLSINGFGFQYLWPESPVWNVLSASFWVALACIFILIFTRSFLNTDAYIPMFKKIMMVLIPLHLLVIITLLFARYIALYLMVIASLLTFITVLTVALICLFKGARQARYYIAGWLIFLTGVTVTILERAVILPYSSVTEYAGQATLTMEVVLLSLALADKINIIRLEKREAEQAALDNQQLALMNLKKADELKDEFLAVTSHELRTPLYGIIGIAESLRDGVTGPISKDMDTQLAMISTSGKRLTSLVDEILDYSKLRHESLELQLKPVYINGVVHLVLAMSKALLKQKPIRLINKIDHPLPPIYADENRLQQILANLIDNAIKYTERGEIIISAFANETHLKISITDTGRGISEEDLRLIFNPFQQGEASLERGSTGVGIGLNITKRLVDLHDGHITVQSKVGLGSTFSVTFPLYEDLEWKIKGSDPHVEVAADEELELLYTKPKRMKDKVTILIADDEVVNVQVLMNQLSLNGYEVLTAMRGEEVFRIIEEYEVDLLILDIMMPGMSGYEVCQRLRKKYSLMELPILMLTAMNQLQDKLISFEAGANDYLVKPCDKQELLSRVKTLVEAKRLTQDLKAINLHLEERILARTEDLNIANVDLKHMNEELVSMAASRRQLLANIAHELGTPVTLIHSYMQSLQVGLISKDDPHYGKLVFDKLHVLTRLIDDLYSLSKLESGKMSLNLVETSLVDWFEEVFYKAEYAVLEAERQFEKVEITALSERAYCSIDVDRMDQLFSNLISNAIKNTERETGEIGIEAQSFEECQLIITIYDNGVGIKKEDLPFIFERFYKKDPLKEEKNGMGLGLAIVKEIVHGHYGEIKAESEEDVGTSITIVLPIYEIK